MSERPWEEHALDSGGWCHDCAASSWVCQREGVKALRKELAHVKESEAELSKAATLTEKAKAELLSLRSEVAALKAKLQQAHKDFMSIRGKTIFSGSSTWEVKPSEICGDASEAASRLSDWAEPYPCEHLSRSIAAESEISALKKKLDEWKAGAEEEAHEADRLRSVVAALRADLTAESEKLVEVRNALGQKVMDLQAELSALKVREGKIADALRGFTEYFRAIGRGEVFKDRKLRQFELLLLNIADTALALPSAQAKGEEYKTIPGHPDECCCKECRTEKP